MHYTLEDFKAHQETLFKHLRIGVVYAGNNQDENAVIHQNIHTRSWKSYEKVATEIAQALETLGFEHVYLFCDDANLLAKLQQKRIDFVWLNTGGMQGINPVSHTPALLEMLGLAYVGHNPLNATILDNKHLFKNALAQLGLPTPKYLVFNPKHQNLEQFLTQHLEELKHLGEEGFISKPVSGRASLHVRFAKDFVTLRTHLKELSLHCTQAILIEEYLAGREFCVGVMGNITAHKKHLKSQLEPFAFSILERRLDKDEYVFTSMDKKPISQERIKLLCPTKDKVLLTNLEHLGKKVFLQLGLETLVRLDVRSNLRGELKVLEANPKPDLKKPDAKQASLLCLGLERYNMDYYDLIFANFVHAWMQTYNQRFYLVQNFAREYLL